ncbi:EAL domain-containing protein [Clostridium sp. P21]|uniref:EAL domain-containing protein n=1 Tax=Clostridium muellerianum TaxID=2716538 RepID=A0A7Y0EJY7_9CLOT|nr:bifunctional diguanylate cyclase/phosphodiesterase [Clostridium muellerianum]NMM64762.1 EAL domain-containing protein [Clostridium muellerianum]
MNIKKFLQNADVLFKSKIQKKFVPLKITMIYLMVGFLWVLLSDQILYLVIPDAHIRTILSTFKGWIYVIVNSLIVYFLIKEIVRESEFWFKKLNGSYEELEKTYEELSDTEEELRVQYEELQKNEEILRESEERYKLALDGSNDVIWEWNMNTDKLLFSDKWTNITGYNLDEYTSLNSIIEDLVEEDKYDLISNIENLKNNKSLFFKSKFRIKSKYEGYKWLYIRGKVLKGSQGKAIKVAGSITDVTETKKIQDEISYRAYHDHLTGLPNRTLLMNKLINALANRKSEKNKGAIIFIDLDDFKKTNDTLGHNYGDELLKEVSELLKKSIGEKNIIGRIGGDEFLILIPNMKDSSYAESLGKKIISIFKNPFQIEEKQIYTSASIGITVFPDDGEDINTLLKNADTAMYKSKENGKNKYCFFDINMSNDIFRKSLIEKNLRFALKNKEFYIYYQPQIDLTSGKIRSLEALLRWNNSELGVVSPGEFIPIAEETGMIFEIGKWVIMEVCAQNKKWKDKGYDYETIAINISSIQLQNENFQSVVKNAIEETGINPEFIEFEITESSLMDCFDDNIRLLNHFKSMGMKIALDDFGTGYSSLNYLTLLPINTLKIDKSFIDRITMSSRDKEITDGIIKLAHNINLEVISEGVEIEEQLNLLKNMSCDIVQGYYFSKPVSTDSMEKFLLKENK